MKIIAVTQRVYAHPTYDEKWDALDQRWSSFLHQCGVIPMLIPNHLPTARALIEQIQIDGILLTGGNNIPAVDSVEAVPERDEVEIFLLEMAIERDLPIMGVCRGMQMIQHYFNIPLERVEGHVQAKQTITVNGAAEKVNSYHHFGTRCNSEEFDVWAWSDDQVVKAIRHKKYTIEGLMWHPERIDPFRPIDIERISRFLRREGQR